MTASITWLAAKPSTFAMVLLVLFTGLRLVMVNAFGFGNDEAYTLAGARVLHLSYFDHLPLHVWFAHLAAWIFGKRHGFAFPSCCCSPERDG